VQGIGNTVLMTPVIKALAARHCQVDVVVSDNGSQEIVELTNAAGRRYLWRENENSLSNLLRLRSEVRRPYDVAYALYPNGKRENALLCLVNATQKIRYSDTRHRFQLLDFLPATRKLQFTLDHDVNSNLKLIDVPVNGNRSPSLIVDEASGKFATEFFSSNNLAHRFVVAIHPGGGGLAKRWSEDKFRELCRELLRDESIGLIVLGGSDETSLISNITNGLGERAVAACGLPIKHVTAIVSNCQLVVANDSAVAHVASAANVPTIVIWGYTDFQRAAPVGNKGLLLRIEYPCNPCYEFARGYIVDCQHHLKCIKNISVAQVYRIVSRYIDSIRKSEPLRPEIFADDPDVSSMQHVASGCLKIDLRAA